MTFIDDKRKRHKLNGACRDAAWTQTVENVAEKELEKQRLLDRQWFDNHRDRSLYLRKALAYEQDVYAAATDGARCNSVIVAKITEIVRTRFFLTLKDKPIDKTMGEWTEAHNYEELLVSILRKMPCPQRICANALETVEMMRTRLEGTKLDA